MALTTFRQGINAVTYQGQELVGLTSLPWYTTGNIARVYALVNGNWVSSFPGSNFGPQRLEPSTDSGPASYIFLTKQAITGIDPSLFGVADTSAAMVNLNGPFVPTQVPDLLAWYDASDAGTLSLGDNQTVKRVASKASAVLPLGPLASTVSPATYDASQLALVVPDATTLATAATLATTRPGVLVVYTDVPGTDSLPYLSLGNSGGSMSLLCSPEDNGGQGRRWLGYAFGNGQSTVFYPGAARGSVRFVNSGTQQQTWVNGVLGAGGVVTNPAPVLANAQFALGGTANNGNIHGQRLIHEVFVVGDYNAADMAILEGYAHWKWGIQALLPAAHAFASRAPVYGDYVDALSLPTAGPGNTTPFSLPSS